MCEDAPAPDHLARASRLHLLALARRPDRPAPVRRRRYSAHVLLGRRHRPRDPAHAVGAARALRRQGLRRVFLHRAVRSTTASAPASSPTTCATASCELDRARRRRSSRPAAPGACTPRRPTATLRPADGMGICYKAGHPADGHGVHAVPSDDAQRKRRADDRRRAR